MPGKTFTKISPEVGNVNSEKVTHGDCTRVQFGDIVNSEAVTNLTTMVVVTINTNLIFIVSTLTIARAKT